jgi:HK97 family phage prohead protease
VNAVFGPSGIVLKSAGTIEGVETKRLLIPSMAQAKMDGDGKTLTGYGSVFGNVDLDKDIIDHGAFAEGMDEFLADGFLGWMHDWGYGGPPIGLFTDATEDDHGLFLSARFHSTDLAEQARVWVKERLEANKSVGLSIGFRILGWERDAAGLRHITKAKLYEVSVVTVPANPKAQVTGLKGLPTIDLGAPPLHGAIEMTKTYVDREESHVAARTEQGRKLASDHVTEATEVAEAFEVAAKRIRDLVTPKAEADVSALITRLSLRSRSVNQ